MMIISDSDDSHHYKPWVRMNLIWKIPILDFYPGIPHTTCHKTSWKQISR